MDANTAAHPGHRGLHRGIDRRRVHGADFRLLAALAAPPVPRGLPPRPLPADKRRAQPRGPAVPLLPRLRRPSRRHDLLREARSGHRVAPGGDHGKRRRKASRRGGDSRVLRTARPQSSARAGLHRGGVRGAGRARHHDLESAMAHAVRRARGSGRTAGPNPCRARHRRGHPARGISGRRRERRHRLLARRTADQPLSDAHRARGSDDHGVRPVEIGRHRSTGRGRARGSAGSDREGSLHGEPRTGGHVSSVRREVARRPAAGPHHHARRVSIPAGDRMRQRGYPASRPARHSRARTCGPLVGGSDPAGSGETDGG